MNPVHTLRLKKVETIFLHCRGTLQEGRGGDGVKQSIDTPIPLLTSP